MLTSIFSRLVITFGDRPLPPRTLAEELVLGILVIIPMGILLGHVTMRLASWPPPKIRGDVWNTIVRLLVADMTMEILLPSIQCLPLSQEPGYSLLLFQQSWGFNCPEEAAVGSALSPTATGLLFGLRLTLVCAGVFLGESFFPLALTGGIACGKSTVADLLENGKPSLEDSVTDGTVYMVDTDTIAHDVLLPTTKDSVYEQVVEAFGDENDILVDSSGETPRPIDRRKLGAVIFANPAKRRMLNQITHPRIIYIMLKRILYGTFLSNKDLTACDVPLLFESGKLRYMFGLSIVVACDPELQLERLTKRNTDLTTQQCKERIASQLAMEKKIKMANFVIYNNGSIEDLEDEVEKVREQIMHRTYGVGLSLLQLLIIIGGSVPVAVLSKLYSIRYGGSQQE
jgi:dephospho-CoA kinase